MFSVFEKLYDSNIVTYAILLLYLFVVFKKADNKSFEKVFGETKPIECINTYSHSKDTPARFTGNYCPVDMEPSRKLAVSIIRFENPSDTKFKGEVAIFTAQLKKNMVPIQNWGQYMLMIEAEVVMVNKTTGEETIVRKYTKAEYVANDLKDSLDEIFPPIEIGRGALVPGTYLELRIYDGFLCKHLTHNANRGNLFLDRRVLFTVSARVSNLTLEGAVYPNITIGHFAIIISTVLFLIFKLKRNCLFSYSTLFGLLIGVIGLLNSKCILSLIRPEGEDPLYSHFLIMNWSHELIIFSIQCLGLYVLTAKIKHPLVGVLHSIFIFLTVILCMYGLLFKYAASLDTYKEKEVFMTGNSRPDKFQYLNDRRSDIAMYELILSLVLLLLSTFRKSKSASYRSSIGLLIYCTWMFTAHARSDFVRTIEYNPFRRYVQFTIVPVAVLALQTALSARQIVSRGKELARDNLKEHFHLL